MAHAKFTDQGANRPTMWPVQPPLLACVYLVEQVNTFVELFKLLHSHPLAFAHQLYQYVQQRCRAKSGSMFQKLQNGK
jgi:hypothetical protein